MKVLQNVCLAAITSFALSTSSWAAEEVRVLRASMGVNTESALGKGMVKFAESVKTRSYGKMRVDLTPGSAADGESDVVESLRKGKTDIAVPESSVLTNFSPSIRAINYPFTFQKESEADVVLDGVWGQMLLSRLPDSDLVGIAYWEDGFRHLTNSKQALSDFKLGSVKGLRVNVIASPLQLDSFKQLGFDPVSLPPSSVYQALSKKEVLAYEGTISSIVTNRLYEVQKHLTVSKHSYSARVFLVSKKTWDSLNGEERSVIWEAARETRTYQRKLSREMSDQALDQLKSKGMQVVNLENREIDSARRRLRDVLERFSREIGLPAVTSMYVYLSQLRSKSSGETVPAPSTLGSIKPVAPK